MVARVFWVVARLVWSVAMKLLVGIIPLGQLLERLLEYLGWLLRCCYDACGGC